MPSQLEIEFHDAMLDVYRRAKDEAGYLANIFRDMVVEQGGVVAAKSLINSRTVSSGYTALFERRRLDITVEAVVVETPKFHPLFTPEERAICARRLQEYGYTPKTRS